VVHVVVAFALPAIATLDVGVQSEGGSVRVALSRHRRGTVRQVAGVLNVAHRGASAEVPENTLAAVRRGIACDADLIELDVQRTADGSWC
jgi:glycerophosphoryl diester phosphodiesterase